MMTNDTRFSFGLNWQRFLKDIDEDRIQHAQKSLANFLNVTSLKGKTFLDVGCGSGLFSLAARRLGAKVHSFDYDLQSVACTKALKEKYHASDEDWVIEQGSALDAAYLSGLGQWDVVYSWGVLHHTGNMWQALKNVTDLIVDRGRLYIALYNDEGIKSQCWVAIKWLYNVLPMGLRWLVLLPAFFRLWGPTFLRDFIRGKPFYTWRHYAKVSVRGMSPWRDVVDWVGGYPFEVATPEAIVDFYKKNQFESMQINRIKGHGCNEFVFRKQGDPVSS